MQKKFKVRTQSWDRGILKTEDKEFDSRDQALAFSQRASGDHAKVYDEQGRIIYHQKNQYKETERKTVKPKLNNQETYA